MISKRKNSQREIQKQETLSETQLSSNKLKLEKIQKIITVGKDYTKIKYEQNIFSVGDNLLIRDLNNGFLIGKLLKILPFNGMKKYSYWPTIEVLWLDYFNC